MAGISNEEFNRIRTSVNIVDVIGSYINLDKKGKNYFGICPFHEDHNPSLSVSEEKQIYTCFVCGATGNVFSFVKDYENISFLEAVEKIADNNGIKLTHKLNYIKRYNTEYEIYNLAVKFYKNNLKSKDGIKAKEYLKSRNIDDNIINDFEIGVSFSDNNLSKLLLNKKYDEKMLTDVGLCGKSKELFDIFRNRIMFPIHNSNGEPIGFSGRIYNGEADSKYVNTRETYIFKKGETLFNYHRAVIEAKKMKYIVICEGQMDAIRIYSSGVKNVVATMGTALTKEHVHLIKKLNVRVVLNMDSDKAGINAALTNGEILKSNGVDVSVIKLDGAKDPDEYILKYGIDSYKDVINHAINLFDFKINYLKSNKNLNNADELTDYINNVIIELNKSDDDILKNVTINKLSEEYNIDKNILLNKITPSEKKVIVETKKITKKQKQNIRAVEEILYYMMNNVKYAKIFTKKLNYIPDSSYFDIEKDIQAYIIINNTINLADFISYEINNGKEDIIKKIISNHNNDIEMSEEEFDGYISIVNKWMIENKINKLKLELKNVTDINRKKELMELITSMKKKEC
mgnify:CR=1 FL=1